jgi:hypothetical protein
MTGGGVSRQKVAKKNLRSPKDAESIEVDQALTTSLAVTGPSRDRAVPGFEKSN